MRSIGLIVILGGLAVGFSLFRTGRMAGDPANPGVPPRSDREDRRPRWHLTPGTLQRKGSP